jgi:hypothetical protein
MPRPLLFLPPRLPLSISRPRFTALLQSLRSPVPQPVLSCLPSLSGVDLARTFWGVPASPSLTETADLLDLLSTPEGATAIADASRAARRPLPLRLAPADLAAVLLTRHATDPALYAPVLARALLPFARIVPTVLPLELVARAPRAAADPSLLTRALETLLTPRRFLAAFHATDDATASIHIAILRRASARAALAPANESRILRRDVVVDTLRIDVPDGRVVIHCDPDDDRARLETAYAAAVATSLFNDPSFFADAPAYTCKPVVLLGSEGLAARRPPGVSRIRVVDITWDDGEGTTHNAHGSDALAAFERLGGARGGYVREMTYRLDAPVSPHPVDVTVHLPDRALYRSARHERLAREALASIGSLTPGAVADDSYTLAPWIHAEWRWRKVLGDALFERMAAAKVLVRVKTRMVGDPAMGKYGWSYVAFDLRTEPGKQYAVAMDRRLPSRDLEGDHRRMWRLDPAAVGRALARELGTDPAPPDATIGDAAIDLGTVRGEIGLRFMAVLRSPGPSVATLVEAMVRAAGTSHLVVLLPDGRTIGGAGVVEIGLGLAELFGQQPIASQVFARVVQKKGDDSVARWRLAAPDTRFVADAKTGRMWLDRCELTLPESGARILRRTAREGGRPVQTNILAHEVSPHRGDDAVIRQTTPRLGAWIRDSFAARGLKAPDDADDIVAFVPKKGWRMTVKCEVL